MNIIYKIVVDVRLFHEYYLTGGKGETIFSFPGQQQRQDYLFQQFLKKIPDTSADIKFVFPPSLEKRYKGYHLRIVSTYSGFKIAVGCRKKILADASIVFEPLVPLPADLEIIVAMERKSQLNLISHHLEHRSVRGAYYFSNDSATAPRTFPFLSAPVAPYDNSLSYEQGDIAEKSGAITVFLNNDAADPWKNIPGNGYASSSDQLLVPFSFHYHFKESDQVTEAEFVLKDNNGVEQFRKIETSAAPMRSVNLQFNANGNTHLSTIPANPVKADSLYSLEVSGSNGYQASYQVLFADELLKETQYAGLINIQPLVADTMYHLLNADGTLPVKDGVGDPVIPLYELWMKSKMVFVQYRHNGQRKLKLSSETTGLLKNDNGVLFTENPVVLSYQPQSYQKQDASFQLLPNPGPDNRIRTDNGKAAVQLLVPDSKIFPLQ